MPGPHSRLRTIGKTLQAEEQRFIGYPEIERKSRELGFGVSVRTIRFYVDEGILPLPKKVGKTPVFEEEWILNVLLAVHLMKTRLNRSLTEIRTILGALQEPPERLADKLSVLYEDCVKGGSLKPTEKAGLIDAFFDLLTGRLGGEPRQATDIKLAALVDAVAVHGRWEGEEWIPPAPAVLLASQSSAPSFAAHGALASANGLPEPVADVPPPPPPPAPLPAAVAALPVGAPPAGAALQVEAPPDHAITARQARAVEQTFVQRFKNKFERLGRVHCPLDGKGYKAGPREHTFIKRDRSGEVVELMKRLRIYDRGLLDSLPLDERREFRVYQRGLFGRGDLKVVVSAIALSPVEELVERRWTDRPLGAGAARRAVEELDLTDDVFHYVGILSTVGWSEDAPEQIPARRNLLACLVESRGDGSWKVHMVPDERWGAVEAVFDPETDEEKVDRARLFMEEHLRPKGEFLILRNLCEDLDVPRAVVQTAIDELLAADSELSVVMSGGREIIKRSRL